MHELTLEDIQDARASLAGKALVTPLVPLMSAATPANNPLLLKAENLQPSGSFKIRGALHCLSRLDADQRAHGVIAYSTGNHAQAVALAARRQQIPATIVMSPDAPAHKVEATRRYGATVVMAESSSQARRLLAEELARATSLYLVPPYDHPDVMAGQGTIGLEILEQGPPPSTVFVPIGGGGLIAGIATALKLSASGVRVIGVEPELENDAWQSFQRGTRVSLPGPSPSIADAIRVQTLGDLTYPLIRRYVDEVVTVSEAQITSATLLAAAEAHLVVEPSGALALAAALVYAGRLLQGRPVVCIASGGNVTLDALCDLRAGGRDA
jgi:threonine dehydratase